MDVKSKSCRNTLGHQDRHLVNLPACLFAQPLFHRGQPEFQPLDMPFDDACPRDE